MKLTKEEQLRVKEFEGWMDDHEEAISIGIGAFFVTLILVLAYLIFAL